MSALLSLLFIFAEPASEPASAPASPQPAAAGARPAPSPAVLFPEYGVDAFDPALTPWGPGRRSSGEVFRSAARLLDQGPLRWRGAWWSLGLGAQLFVRGELRNNADFSDARRDLTPGADHRARLSLRASLFDRVGFVLEFQDVRPWGGEASTTTTTPFTALHQGFLDLRITPWLDLRLGRQELCYGEDRLLGCLDWAQSARAFDGLFVRATAGIATIDLFGFYVRQFQRVDAMPEAVVNIGSFFYGSYLRLRPFPAFSADAYVLGLSDDTSSAAAGQRDVNHTITLGSRLVGKVLGLTLTGEGAVQTGRMQLPDATRLPILAGAFAARAQYVLPLFGAPDALFEVVAATGGDGTDGVQRQFNQLFPTAHAHLGYIDYVGWSNVIDAHAALGWRPRGIHVWVDYHHFLPWAAQAPWLNAAGAVFRPADPARTSRTMGDEVDLSLTVPITVNVSVATAFGVFLPGRAYGSNPSTWGFLYLRSQL